MESWRLVWRAMAPSMPTLGLISLYKALRTDDPRLMQGATTTPPPLISMTDEPCEGADAIGWIGWHGLPLHTVGQVEEWFARCCYETDQAMQEPAACRWLLEWFDDGNREMVFNSLAAEVYEELRKRFPLFTEQPKWRFP